MPNNRKANWRAGRSPQSAAVNWRVSNQQTQPSVIARQRDLSMIPGILSMSWLATEQQSAHDSVVCHMGFELTNWGTRPESTILILARI